MEFGHLLGEPQHETTVKKKIEVDNVYDVFVEYFNDPTLQKVNDDEQFSIYMTRVKCLIIGTCRYIIVNVPHDNLQVGSTRKLSDLQWAMIQTRTLEGKFECTNHTYQPKTSKIFESTLSIVKRTKKRSEYSCENIPVKVIVFHKKDIEFEYPNNGNLNSAIEIYETVVARI